ncbi:sensor histidine kinase [Catenulispora acidiphila]|uniref:sensor histidine kinase n=1 Tax=Catenulispora acidiphila TaxID=304895 RepID=UPI0002E1B38F|nr:HAMP domain-containing sensor histidine kinase [Catenulispora acidiphila]
MFDRQLPSNPVLKADVTIAVQDPVPRPDPSLGRQAGSFLSKDAVLDQLLVQGGLALGAVAVAATGLAWLTAGRMLRPLHRITATAGRIAGAPAADRGLHERIALNGPADEVKELADTFDLMLSRLDQSFDSQRRFIGNASHELRTPLGLNQALIELALQRTDTTPEMRRLGETLLEVNSRHERLIDGLLVLARSEGEPGQGSFVDLADIAEHVVEQTPAGDVEVTCAVEEAPAIGNPVLLERLVQNLVENGIRYNIRHRGWVRVTTGTAADGSTRLQVSNTGPIVPRHEIPTLFEPFRRLGGERPSGRSHGTSGAGLGLSIVRAVSRAHGGDVQAEPRDGGGLIVTVTLPRAE